MELVGAHGSEFILISADFYKLSSPHRLDLFLMASLSLHCLVTQPGGVPEDISTEPVNITSQTNLNTYLMCFVLVTHSRVRHQGT